jgi:quercetin dioxygenase-like cupin family protein
MSLDVRRVITAFNENGKSIVKYDDISPHTMETSNEVTVSNIWTTSDYPVPLENEVDLGGVKVPREPPAKHSIFRVVKFDPGNKRDMHITKSVDYAVIMSGTIEMELDDDVIVHLKKGDVLVQQATIHGWRNTGKEPCVIAFILISTEE